MVVSSSMVDIPSDIVIIPSTFSIYGPILIGTFIGIFGCGALLLGTLMYLDRYRAESWYARCLLLGIVALNIAQSACDCSRVLKILIYHPTLIYFLDVGSRPEELLSPLFSIIICTAVQVFLIRRCILFTRITRQPVARGTLKSRIIVWTVTAVLGAGVALSFAGGLGTAIKLHTLPNFTYAYRGFNPTGVFPTLATIWLSASAATDVLISLVIISQLSTAYRRRDPAKQHKMIASLIRVLAQGAVALTLLQVAILVCYLHSNSTWSDFPSIFISKVYSLSLLATFSSPKEAVYVPPRRISTNIAPRMLPSPVFEEKDLPNQDIPVPALDLPETQADKALPRKTQTLGVEIRDSEDTELKSPQTINRSLVDHSVRFRASGESKWTQTEFDDDGEKILGVLDMV